MRRLFCIIPAVLCLLPLLGQTRKVTPVNPVTTRPVAPVKEKKKKPEKAEEKQNERPGSVVETTDDLGNTILLDTISGNEWVDSMALAQPKVIGNIYPLLDAVDIGVDFWPAVNRIFGQKQGLAGLWARLSLYNRYFVVFETGLGNAKSRPEGMNYTYTSPISPYFKIGLDYNFFYNSDRRYQAYLLFRYGISRFKYSLTDVDVNNGYWNITTHPHFPTQTTTNGFIQLGVGIHVTLWGPIAMGWNVKYQRVVHHSAETFGAPWAVPGMGVRSSELGVSLSLIYTISLHDPISLDDKDKKK